MSYNELLWFKYIYRYHDWASVCKNNHIVQGA